MLSALTLRLGSSCATRTHRFFVLSPSDSDDSENQRDFSNYYVTGGTRFLLTLGSFYVFNSVQKCRKVIVESLLVFTSEDVASTEGHVL